MAFLERYLTDGKESSYFLRYASNVTSQCGEDGIIAHIFSLLPKPSTRSHRYLVDIGAWDGKHLSNSYNLLYNQHDWDGLLFEAHPERVQELKRLYSSKQAEHADTMQQSIRCAQCLVGFEGDNSLETLLAVHDVPYDFDFLSIDVDGNDYHIWRSIADETSVSLSSSSSDFSSSVSRNKQYRPSVVCIEFNPTIPNDIIFIQEADLRIHQGSSLRALVNLGQSMSYSLIVTTTFNAIFLKNELMSFVPSWDYSIENLHYANMSTSMFQTYDGGRLEMMFMWKMLTK
jgi:hypothetical protein